MFFLCMTTGWLPSHVLFPSQWEREIRSRDLAAPRLSRLACLTRLDNRSRIRSGQPDHLILIRSVPVRFKIPDTVGSGSNTKHLPPIKLNTWHLHLHKNITCIPRWTGPRVWMRKLLSIQHIISYTAIIQWSALNFSGIFCVLLIILQ
jgi:hypothetical protein